jgi:hypothetical protein
VDVFMYFEGWIDQYKSRDDVDGIGTRDRLGMVWNK